MLQDTHSGLILEGEKGTTQLNSITHKLRFQVSNKFATKSITSMSILRANKVRMQLRIRVRKLTRDSFWYTLRRIAPTI